MTRYSVTWTDENGEQHFAETTTLTEAKKIMRKHPGATGSKTKVWANGDWENAGPITLSGSNKFKMFNGKKMTSSNY